MIRKKLIEVALPLEAINVASAREKSIRHGHPSTLHLWWARRPLAACRAVLFTQLVDDPSAWPDQFPTDESQERERQRLFGLITDLVQWENSSRDPVINAARVEIARSVARGRKAEAMVDAQDEAVLRIPPAYGADGQYRNLSGPEALSVSRYLAEVAPPVHDPFAGGGSIPLEAQRLGLRAIATDLNPVAVLINKALIEIPPKFAGMPPVNPDAQRRQETVKREWKGAQGLAEDVRYYGKWMRDEAFKRIGHLYPDAELPKHQGGGSGKVIAWLWARTVPSPNPACGGAYVPLVSTFWLFRKPGKEAWIEPQVDRTTNTWRFEVRHGLPPHPEATETGTKAGRGGNFRCIISGDAIPVGYVRTEAQAGRMGARLLAIVADGPVSRVYLSPTDLHANLAAQATPVWFPEELVPSMGDEGAGRRHGGRHKSTNLPAYGMTRWCDAFSQRQLLALDTFSGLVEAVRERAFADCLDRGMNEGVSLNVGGTDAVAYGETIGMYLALAINKGANLWSSLTSWMNDRGAFRETFARQAIPMVWDYAEANPFSDAGGCFGTGLEKVALVLSELHVGGLGIAVQADVASTSASIETVYSTDPPYYDNISYADVSDFFYVWLRRSLRGVFPDLFSTVLTPKTGELIATRYRFGGDVERAKQFFEDGLNAAFAAMRLATSQQIPLGVYYAFKQTEDDEGVDQTTASTGWESMLTGLLRAGFSITGTWPVRTEGQGRIIALGRNALATSIVLVCRPRPDSATTITRGDFRRLLKMELPDALKALQHGNIAPVDMAQASIGPGMAIFSRHAKILEADGKAMPVRTALQLINQALDEYLAEQEGEFDPDTRFAITWFETRQFETGAFGEAETLAKARNVSVSGVAEAGIVQAVAGKVRLIKRDELPEDWDPTTDKRLTIWEATQHLIKRLDKGEPAAAALLAALGSRAAPARDLAYRLYTTCERKGWAEEARAYNGLVVSWPELEKLAALVGRSAKPQMDLL